jgi:hypothetical protein
MRVQIGGHAQLRVAEQLTDLHELDAFRNQQ